MFQSHVRRRAFTLVELLVVIAIIGILIALLLPAVQAAREAARRSQCTNNLKQLALGMHNYHDTYRSFPPGMFDTGHDGHAKDSNGNTVKGRPERMSWYPCILPFVEQKPLADKYRPQAENNVQAFRWSSKNVVVEGFCCPSEALGTKTSGQGFHGNYVLCWGDRNSGPAGNNNDLRGMFYALSKTKMGSVSDGTSSTILASELVLTLEGSRWGSRPKCGGSHDVRGRYFNALHMSALFTTMRPPNSRVGDLCHYCNSHPVALVRKCTTGNIEVFARSYHPGGANVALADGSIRLVSETIDQATFRALGTRAQGEVVKAF